MATVIDALIVTLGLDGANYKKGAKDASASTDKMKKDAERAAKEMEARGKQAAQFFSKVRNEALLFFGVFTAGRGLTNFAVDMVATAASLGRLSDNLSTSVEDLDAWQRASQRAGGSAAGITAQLQESQAAVAKFNTGISDDSMLWFYNLGGQDKAFKNAKEYLLARADIIAETNKVDPGRAQLQAQQMGISSEQYNLIKKGRAGILELVDAQEKNSRFTRQQAEAAANLENKLRDLHDRLMVTGTTILIALMPAIEKLADKLIKLADTVAEHKEDIARWVDGAVAAIVTFVKWADKLADAVGGWKNVFVGLAAIQLSSTIVSLLAMATAITKVGFALTALAGGAGGMAILAKLGLVAGGVGVAAAAGYGVGTVINKATENTSFHDKLGEVIARTLASMGNADAAEAVARRTGKNDYSAYYKPGVKPPVAQAKPTKQQNENAAGIAKKLVAMGWTSAQAAGIAGSFMQESGLDANAKNKQSGAYGIGQWLGSRVKDFEKWSGKKLEGSTQDEQLRFFQYEVTQGKEKAAGDRLRASNSASETAAIHSKYYERPGEDESNVARRQTIANSVLARLQQDNANAAANIPVQASAQPVGSTTNTKTSTNSTQTNINGPINIQTAATDAEGVAKSIGPAIQRYGFVSQANTGIS